MAPPIRHTSGTDWNREEIHRGMPMQLLLIAWQFNQMLLFHYVVLKLTWKGEILLDGPESSVFQSFCFPLWRFDPIPGHGLPLRGFAITLTEHTALGRTPLDKWSARRTDLNLTTHYTHNRHPCPRRDSNPQSQQTSGVSQFAIQKCKYK